MRGFRPLLGSLIFFVGWTSLSWSVKRKMKMFLKSQIRELQIMLLLVLSGLINGLLEDYHGLSTTSETRAEMVELIT
ncbi:hypothetical protein ACFX2I_036035 [Malus domestica]